MRFVGLDTSYRNTGVVILDDSGVLLRREHLQCKERFEPEGFGFWRSCAEETLQPGDVVAIEGLSYGSIGRSHVLAASYAMWLVEANRHGMLVFVVPPIRVKKWAVNDVKAKKPKIIAWARSELGVGKKEKLSEHEADALALAQIAQQAYLSSLMPLDYLEPHRAYLLRNKKNDGITQCLGKSYFEGEFYAGERGKAFK